MLAPRCLRLLSFRHTPTLICLESTKLRYPVLFPVQQFSFAWRRSPQEAEVFAAPSWLFEVVQMPEIFPPAPMKSAADASATNAIRDRKSTRLNSSYANI